MSIPVLIQTYDEARRLAIAGASVAPGDFRLRNLIPALEQAGRKAPVFAKVAEAARRLVDGDEQTSAEALLDLASLVGAVLYTQGETGILGESTPLATVELGRPRTHVPAQLLKSIQEALTRAGGGRFEVVRDGFEQGAFNDLRLVAPALGALDDGYTEIADLAADKILPLYGPAIVPELAAAFDPAGKGGQARRLSLMHRLDPVAARPHVLRALEEGSPEVRVAAVACLTDSPEDLPLLLEQAKARSKGVRAAALKALGGCRSDEAARPLLDVIARGELALAVEALRENRHPTVTAALLDEAERLRDALFASKPGDARKTDERDERLALVLDALIGREDARTERILLSLFERVHRVAAIKWISTGPHPVDRLVSALASATPRTRDALIEGRDKLPAECIGEAFEVARRTRTPAEVFDVFRAYFAAVVHEKKKERDPAWARRERIVEQLRSNGPTVAPSTVRTSAPADLDPRWLDLAVEIGRLDLVNALAVPGHAGALRFLQAIFEAENERPAPTSELFQALDAMTRIGHPGAVDALVELLRRYGRSGASHGYYWIFHTIGPLIARLPRAEALPKLEALLPTLPGPLIDPLLDSLNALQRAGSEKDASI